MNTLDIDQLEADVIPRSEFDRQRTIPERLQPESPEPSDNAAVALEMVSEAAAAIKHLEEQSAEAVARARELANSIVKKLESTEARAERAEEAQRHSEAEAQELSAELARTRADLDTTRQQLAENEDRLAATEDRVRLTEAESRDAQHRALESQAAIEKIMDAIRTQLPARQESAAAM
ncbi:MAG TPA: ABC transporter permease [Methylocystis sp.]|nr:ABC transporter permease [Methylocystis sp.]